MLDIFDTKVSMLKNRQEQHRQLMNGIKVEEIESSIHEQSETVAPLDGKNGEMKKKLEEQTKAKARVFHTLDIDEDDRQYKQVWHDAAQDELKVDVNNMESEFSEEAATFDKDSQAYLRHTDA